MQSRHLASGLTLIGFIAFLSIIEADAATRYVDNQCASACPASCSTYNPSTRACTGGSDLVYPTSALGVASMASGDILYYRAGTYGGFTNPPSGGGASSRTVLSAYPINRTCSGHNPADPLTCCGSTYERVVFQRTTGAIVQIKGAGAVPGPKMDRNWITVEGFVIDGSTGDNNCITITGGGAKATNFPACDNGSHDAGSTPDHLRFLNNEIKNSHNQGFLGELWNDHIEVICNWVHDNGTDSNTDHGLYMGGSDNWIVGNLIENNKRYGMHLYTQPTGTPAAPLCDPYSTDNLIERNTVRGNSTGIGVLRGSINTTVRNNVVYGHTRGESIGIKVTTGSAGINKIYNNTSANNGQQGLYLDDSADNSVIRNNIYDGFFQHAGTTNVTNTNNYNINTTGVMPQFVDAANGDYRLRAGDARIGAGFNLFSAGVTVDKDGNARPAVGGFTIGAYEFGASGPPVQTFDFSIENDVDPEVGLAIAQGASDAAEITLTTLGGTATDVTLTAEGLPSNATASFSDANCTPTCTSTVTIDTANTTPEGTYTVTIRGRTGESIGSIQRTTSFTLIVTCN